MWGLWENERRNPKNGVLHRVRGGAYSGTLRVRTHERMLEVEEDAVKCGGYFRLRSGGADYEPPRSGESGVGAEKKARATQEGDLKRRV